MSEVTGVESKRSFLLNSSTALMVFVGVFIAIVLLWVANAYFALTGELPFDLFNVSMTEPNFGATEQVSVAQSERGPVGDSFGIINSLFSGMAFVGLVYAILLQRQELHLVKEERDDTRSILRHQQANLDEQNKVTKKQAFETTFFNLLSLVSTSRAGIMMPGKFEVSGERALSNYAANAERTYSKQGAKSALADYRNSDPYKITTTHINLFVSAALLLEEYNLDEQGIYINILCDSISPSEQILLAFEAYSPGRDMMASIIADHGLLNEAKSVTLERLLREFEAVRFP
ncbi:hypothetical protein SAMN04488518_113118 [Pseudovibrio ascidiaceicola]|uniref:Uncharacterized protein n=1 Tax=Pseudovibrio ascidiaceicola TaxID=285279 RepID=A0A1I4E0N9_9HYPH|nr:hypothetical protein [Pseudovibrio ascidiaceicola]SFK99414.1 hypothetical protein SAMN04488518_113118 [Pseudovibrio ascidiaceicola]